MSQGHTGIAGVVEKPSNEKAAPVVSDHPSRSLRFVTFTVATGRAYGLLTIAKEDRMRWMDLLANGTEEDRAAVLDGLRESLKG